MHSRGAFPLRFGYDRQPLAHDPRYLPLLARRTLFLMITGSVDPSSFTQAKTKQCETRRDVLKVSLNFSFFSFPRPCRPVMTRRCNQIRSGELARLGVRRKQHVPEVIVVVVGIVGELARRTKQAVVPDDTAQVLVGDLRNQTGACDDIIGTAGVHAHHILRTGHDGQRRRQALLLPARRCLIREGY